MKNQLTAAALVVLSGLMGPANAQISPSSMVNPGALLPRTYACGEEPDPAVVFGHFAFVDPTTGEAHVPYSTAHGSPTAVGYPRFGPQFRSRSNPEQTIEMMTGPGGVSSYTPPGGAMPVALRYRIRLNADRRAGPPVMTSDGWDASFTYNPDQWCFWTVVVFDDGGAYNAMQQRGESLPGLPDF